MQSRAIRYAFVLFCPSANQYETKALFTNVSNKILYPDTWTIRITLDNHSAHIFKETMNYLASRPNRFVYVHTPKHGSCLNLIETFFSKISRTFLRYTRVDSKEELKQRILKGIEEINAEPVVHKWENLSFASNIHQASS
jgi:transposase